VSTYQGGVPLAEVARSGFVEGSHHGSLAVLDAGGRLIASAGDPYGSIFPRSSNKPMQAAGMLRAGLDLADPADLALVAASHYAEPSHVDRVRAMLRRGGLTEDALQCPPDLPLSESARDDVLRHGGGPARVLMNCSGKHTGMLLTCLANGWSTMDYLDPTHPLQHACRTAVEDLSGEKAAAVGVDGCGAPVLALSLSGLARAFLACVDAAPGTEPRRVSDAMRANPELVSGTGREDARLMRAVPGLLSKVGAEGVLAVAVPGVGAVALKIDDGAARARIPALVPALGVLGVAAAELDEMAEVALLGGGRAVGSVRALPVALASHVAK
jgi:L-asparaginase II